MPASTGAFTTIGLNEERQQLEELGYDASHHLESIRVDGPLRRLLTSVEGEDKTKSAPYQLVITRESTACDWRLVFFQTTSLVFGLTILAWVAYCWIKATSA